MAIHDHGARHHKSWLEDKSLLVGAGIGALLLLSYLLVYYLLAVSI